MATIDLTFEKGLPANLDAERFALGSVLLNQDVYFQVAGAVEPEDSSLEKHRRLCAPVKDLYARGKKLERLGRPIGRRRRGHRESLDGFSWPASFGDGRP